MSKIYSRRRIKLPKIFIKTARISKRNNKIVKVVFIIIVASITSKVILEAISPIFDNLCKNKAKYIATEASNNKVTEIMREHTYEEFFTIEKDNNGNINMIKAKVSAINEIVSDVAVRIQEKINDDGRDNISIALGSFTGFKLLAGKGPRVNIEISSNGNVKTDLKSEFTSQGINQTLHRIYLNVDCQVSVLTPFQNITTEITNQVLLAENVIVGKIPETYYNLEDLEESEQLNLLK